jgi:ribosomal protein L39E
MDMNRLKLAMKECKSHQPIQSFAKIQTNSSIQSQHRLKEIWRRTDLARATCYPTVQKNEMKDLPTAVAHQVQKSVGSRSMDPRSKRIKEGRHAAGFTKPGIIPGWLVTAAGPWCLSKLLTIHIAVNVGTISVFTIACRSF